MINNLIQNNEDMSHKRLKICYECPLYTSKYGGSCNNKLWLNLETNDVSTESKPGYKRGCGCILASKVKNPASSCPLEKW